MRFPIVDRGDHSERMKWLRSGRGFRWSGTQPGNASITAWYLVNMESEVLGKVHLLGMDFEENLGIF